MTKKRASTIDERMEPSATAEGTEPNFRVDRVYFATPAAPATSRTRASSPVLQTVTPAPAPSREVTELKRQLDETRREFDDTRELWSAERDMLEEKHASEIAKLRMTFETELASARKQGLHDASEREKVYEQEAELLAQHHDSELAVRDDQIAALQQEVAALKLRCVTLEGELDRSALERSKYIAHLEQGLALFGANASAADDEPLDIELRRDDE
jgi:hypothetical protein